MKHSFTINVLITFFVVTNLAMGGIFEDQGLTGKWYVNHKVYAGPDAKVNPSNYYEITETGASTAERILYADGEIVERANLVIKVLPTSDCRPNNQGCFEMSIGLVLTTADISKLIKKDIKDIWLPIMGVFQKNEVQSIIFNIAPQKHELTPDRNGMFWNLDSALPWIVRDV